jgi:serine/threonine protein kinase
MGDVYLAEDKRLGRQVAIKLLPAEFTADAERVKRFAQEARAASALNHPNIITIYEIDDLESSHYIVTEYVDGETLRQRMDRGPLKLQEALDLAIQIATALDAAHRASIIHRDIKPENVMVRTDGYVKVLDFGLAKLVEPSTASLDAERLIEASVNTETGLVMGTPRCMSPEQARGERADARTDIFSLGIVLYEMVTGRAPFAGATRNDVIAAILRDEPPSLSGQTPAAPPELGRIVEKALRKSREERYQTAKDLLDDLNRLKQKLAAVDSASEVLDGRPLKAGPKFNRWTTVAVVLLVGMAWMA